MSGYLKTAFAGFILIFLFASFMLVHELYPYREAQQSYERMREFRGEMQDVKTVQKERIPVCADFQKLKQEYPDIVGWVYCEGLKIDYPVVQGNDNEFYLDHLPDGTPNKAGSVFMDYESDFHSPLSNVLVYGHHMKDGSMFAGLEQYEDQDFYEQHSFWYYLTEEACYRVEIIRAFRTTAESPLYQLQFGSLEEKTAYLEKNQVNSSIESCYAIDVQNRLITFSTCAYDQEDARFVVQGQLVPLKCRQGIAPAAFHHNVFFFLLITFNRVNSSRSFSSKELVISVTNV